METKTPNVSGRSAWLRDNITKHSNFSAIITLLVVPPLTQDNFLGTSNLKNLLRDTAPLMIMFAGMITVLLFDSIDLSMGAVCSVSNMTYVHLKLALQDSFSNPLLTSPATTAVSLVSDLASDLAPGIIRVRPKVPSFIASLGFMSLWQSVTLLTTQNPESVSKVLQGTIEWHKIVFGVAGLPLIVVIAIILFIHCVTRYTPSGRTISAIDGNERTIRMVDMGVDRIKILVPAINGVLVVLAGTFLAASLRPNAPTIGDPSTLKIVAACVLGGTSLASGKGSELGTVLGTSIVAIVENGMNFIGVNAYYQNTVFGIFVLAAIALTVDRSIRGQIVK